MIRSIRITYDREGYILLPSAMREIRKREREIMQAIGHEWHRRFGGPNKFTATAARRYRYTRRKTKDVFSGRVRKAKGGRALSPDPRPLVWSGRSLALSRQYKVHAVNRGGTQRLSVTYPIRAFNFRTKYNQGLNMRAEFTAVLPSEIDQIGRSVQREFESKLRKIDRRFGVDLSTG